MAAQKEIPSSRPTTSRCSGPCSTKLDDVVLAGTVGTADQPHTQRGHARYLHTRQGFYVFTIGGNQPKLFADD